MAIQHESRGITHAISTTVNKSHGIGVGSKAADAKSRKRPMSKRPMLLKAADVA